MVEPQIVPHLDGTLAKGGIEAKDYGLRFNNQRWTKIMEQKAQEWLQNRCDEFMKRVGVGVGQDVLDFGCKGGNYTRNAAKVVGGSGTVYALDKDEEALEEVSRVAEEEDVENVECLHVPEEQETIPLSSDSVDMVLLYDVLHGGYFPESSERKEVLLQIHDVLKPGGILSLYPTHLKKYGLTFEQILGEVRQTGFQLEDRSFRRLVHDGELVRGWVFSYCKHSEEEW